MTRKNLEGLNDSMHKPKRNEQDPTTLHKINMYKYLEYNRPATGTGRFRMRDNFMMNMNNRIASPSSRERDFDTIDILANQSAYSVMGTPMKENEPVFDALPPKSPTPPPPMVQMAPPTHPNMSHSNMNLALNSLTAMTHNLQDKIELEFKAQMSLAKEELLYIQKEITDKYAFDLCFTIIFCLFEKRSIVLIHNFALDSAKK